MLLHVILPERQVDRENCKAILIRYGFSQERIRIHKRLARIKEHGAGTGADLLCAVDAEYGAFQLPACLDVLFFHRDFHFLAVICENSIVRDDWSLLILIDKCESLRLCIQYKAFRSFCFLDPVGTDGKVFYFGKAGFIRDGCRDKRILFIDSDPVTIFIPLIIRSADVLVRIDGELSTCKAFFFVAEIFTERGEYFTVFLNGKPSLYRSVLHFNLDQGVPGGIVHLVCRIGVHIDFKSVVVQHISLRGVHFLDAVASDL